MAFSPLRAILIAPHPDLHRGILARIGDSGLALVLKALERYPDLADATSLIRAHSAQVVFLDVASREGAIEFGSQLQRSLPGLAVVALYGDALHHEGGHQLLLNLLHGGIREVLCHPFPENSYVQAMSRLATAAHDTPGGAPPSKGEVYAFLPAKGGAGASTIAVNTALALARMDAGKVLLADCDLNCGAVRFQLKIDHPFSVQEALEKAPRLDDSIWPDLAVPAPQVPGGTLHLLASGAIVPRYPHPATHAVSLLDYARGHYAHVLADLSASVDQLAADLVTHCQRIYLVVQPELCTIHLAREKLRFLRSLDIEDRVEVLVNQWRKNAVFSLADIESVLGLPVSQSLSGDPKAAYQALLSGTGIDPASTLGVEVESLAARIANAPPSATNRGGTSASGRKRRIEFFSVLPAKYSLFPSQR